MVIKANAPGDLMGSWVPRNTAVDGTGVKKPMCINDVEHEKIVENLFSMSKLKVFAKHVSKPV
jgi:hypothetical protein